MIKPLECTIRQIRIFYYVLPFKTPLSIGRKLLKQREGFVIEITDENGLTGYGEAAPLEGYSRESIKQVREQLVQAADVLTGTVLNRDLTQCMYPSTAFGLETALSNIAGERLKLTSSPFPFSMSDMVIPVNALLYPVPEVEKAVKELVSNGFRTIKVKVGRDSLDQDAGRVIRAASALPPGGMLRLDANRLWNLKTALDFFHRISDCRAFIEYIEEPFDWEVLDEITGFFNQTHIPVALDESLESLYPGTFEIPQGVAALVLKPTLLGGVEDVMNLIYKAKQGGVKTVISSCFECGPGFTELCKMVHYFDLHTVDSGLDTLKYLENTLFLYPIPFHNASISVSHLWQRMPFLYDLSRMSLIYP